MKLTVKQVNELLSNILFGLFLLVLDHKWFIDSLIEVIETGHLLIDDY